MGLAHWDDVEGRRAAKGEMDATWHRLGRAAGTVGVGVNRIRIAPERLSTPPHSHGASEEIYHVLGGSGLAWQDEAVHEIGPGDTIVHRADEMEHTLRGGPDGLDVLVFATSYRTELGWLPRSGAVRFGWPWVAGRTDDPWDLEAAVGPLAIGEPAPRPPNIVHLDACASEEYPGETGKELAGTAGSVQAGLNWSRLHPNRIGPPPHCHSEEEEVVVVLEGDGTLELWPSPVAAARGVVREDVPLRAGHVVARPPGSRVGHAVRGGASGMTVLVYGTRKPNDIAYYPRSNKVQIRGVGLIARLEPLDYDDGEPEL